MKKRASLAGRLQVAVAGTLLGAGWGAAIRGGLFHLRFAGAACAEQQRRRQPPLRQQPRDVERVHLVQRSGKGSAPVGDPDARLCVSLNFRLQSNKEKEKVES